MPKNSLVRAQLATSESVDIFVWYIYFIFEDLPMPCTCSAFSYYSYLSIYSIYQQKKKKKFGQKE